MPTYETSMLGPLAKMDHYELIRAKCEDMSTRTDDQDGATRTESCDRSTRTDD